MGQANKEKTRVLFFAWGDSIHARRRIKIFTDDFSFEVGVVSTFQYDFENAENYYLSNVSQPAIQKNLFLSRVIRLARKIIALPLYLTLRIFSREIGLNECSMLLADIWLVRRYVNEFKPKVIFLQTLMYPCYLTYFLPNNIPSIITFWNGDVTWWAQWTGIERSFKRQIVSRGVRRASAITVNSKSAHDACLGYGIDQDKIKLIRYPGINLELFKPQPDKAVIKERLGIRHEKVVLCPRGLGGYLNSDVIIEAVADVVNQFPGTLFIFLSGVGQEEMWESHRRRAEQLGVASNLCMVGKVDWENMPDYYCAANAMVSMSSNDSLPNCMLEAMACGVPVIMGDIAQIRDWITDGENGFLVPPRDPALLAKAIVKVFNNNDQIIDQVIKRNIKLAAREVDSKAMSESVKTLVQNIANKATASERH